MFLVIYLIQNSLSDMALWKSMMLLELNKYLLLIQIKISWNPKENMHDFIRSPDLLFIFKLAPSPAYVDTVILDEIWNETVSIDFYEERCWK